MSFLSKIELKKQLRAIGISVDGNYIRKSEIIKAIASDSDDDTLPGQKGIFYDEEGVWKKLMKIFYPSIADIRITLMRVIKTLEKNPEKKNEIIRLYGTNFIKDLGILADLYNVLK